MGNCVHWLAAALKVTAENDIPPPGALALQSIDQKEAVQICSVHNIDTLAQLPTYEPKPDTLGTWMIWMVHRVALNDPELRCLDFTNFTMPNWTEEKYRIAPKLIASLERNTHLVELRLTNTNLGACGKELCDALEKNTSLRILNIESNALSSQDLKLIFKALETNDVLQELRCDNQFGSRNPGASVFKAVRDMLEKNIVLQKLGMYLTDPSYRCQINQMLIRNTDHGRKKRRIELEFERIRRSARSRQRSRAHGGACTG